MGYVAYDLGEDECPRFTIDIEEGGEKTPLMAITVLAKQMQEQINIITSDGIARINDLAEQITIISTNTARRAEAAQGDLNALNRAIADGGWAGVHLSWRGKTCIDGSL